MATEHRPVMLDEVVAAVDPRDGETIVDATFGGGGHAREILERLSAAAGSSAWTGTLGHRAGLGASRRTRASASCPGPSTRSCGRWSRRARGSTPFSSIWGSRATRSTSPGRGFSYVREGPLDMRMDPRSGVSAAEYLNRSRRRDLERVLTRYGDVPRGEARRVAREVVRRRPLETTTDLLRGRAGGYRLGRAGRQPCQEDLSGRPRSRQRRARRARARACCHRTVARPGRTAGGSDVPIRRRQDGQALYRGAGGALRVSTGSARLRVRGEADLPPGRGGAGRPSGRCARTRAAPRPGSGSRPGPPSRWRAQGMGPDGRSPAPLPGLVTTGALRSGRREGAGPHEAGPPRRAARRPGNAAGSPSWSWCRCC